LVDHLREKKEAAGRSLPDFSPLQSLLPSFSISALSCLTAAVAHRVTYFLKPIYLFYHRSQPSRDGEGMRVALLRTHAHVSRRRIHSAVNNLLPRESTLHRTAETVYRDESNMPAGLQLGQNKLAAITSPPSPGLWLLTESICCISLVGYLLLSVPTYSLYASCGNLTHLLWKQIHILLVTSFWGIVELYQCQSLKGDKQVLHTPFLFFFFAQTSA